MAVAVPTFPTGDFNIDLQSDNEMNFTTLENVFGDGYIQSAADGLNSNRDSWRASWTNVNDEEATLIYSFLRERAGYKPFYYQAPGDGVIKQWTARDVVRQPMGVSGNKAYWKISCTLKEEFGSTIEVKFVQMLKGVECITGLGIIKGNSPASGMSGVAAVTYIGILWPSTTGIPGVSATGAAGSINASSLGLTGVGAQAVAGNVTVTKGTANWVNAAGISATGVAGNIARDNSDIVSGVGTTGAVGDMTLSIT